MNSSASRRKRKRRSARNFPVPAPVSPPQFAAAVSRVAVAQICEYVGFSSSKASALEALCLILSHYLQTLAKSASEKANYSGRTDCNIFDVVVAVDAMNANRGFAGASDARIPLLRSKPLTDIIRFMRAVDEIPFAKPIRRERANEREICRSFKQLAKDPPSKHVPPWLPAFPELNTEENREEKSVCLRQGETASSGTMKQKHYLSAEPRGRLKFKLRSIAEPRVKFNSLPLCTESDVELYRDERSVPFCRRILLCRPGTQLHKQSNADQLRCTN